MVSPRVGVVRDSMLTNPLLIKPPLGRTQSSGLNVPGPEFTFGIPSGSLRGGGVAEVLSNWRVQSRQGGSASHRRLVPDFVSLNRDAVRSGLVTARELSQFRAQRGGAKQGPAPGAREERASRRPAVPDIAFGVTTRPPSPLANLLAHQYGRRWLDEQLRRSGALKQQQRMKVSRISETRTSLLRRTKVLPHIESPQRTSRFSQVAPSLDTFRDQESRVRAFRARWAVQALLPPAGRGRSHM